jgi:hypothetical protein
VSAKPAKDIIALAQLPLQHLGVVHKLRRLKLKVRLEGLQGVIAVRDSWNGPMQTPLGS